MHDAEHSPMYVETPFVTLNSRHNNFDALRFVFASLVVFSHSYPLGEGSEDREPLLRLTQQISLGSLAVNGFFIISGFLIAASWDRRKSVSGFLQKRILRIYPGFIIANGIGVYLAAPFAQTDNTQHSRISAISFSWDCLWLKGCDVQGLFQLNSIRFLNGSLWTIPYEFWCYIGVILLGVIPLLNRRVVVLFVFIASLLIAYMFPAFHLQSFGGGLPGRIFGAPYCWARFLPLYLAGVVAWRFREKYVMSSGLLFSAIAALAMTVRVPHSWLVMFPICGTYILMWLAFNRHLRLHRFAKHGDYSYGMYLYAWPIQQFTVFLYGDGRMNAHALFVMSFPICVLFGAGSWYLVERPFLRRA